MMFTKVGSVLSFEKESDMLKRAKELDEEGYKVRLSDKPPKSGFYSSCARFFIEVIGYKLND